MTQFQDQQDAGVSLHELAQENGTDKRGHGYIAHYARYFTPLRDEPLRILEMGVAHGRSIQMWRHFFSQAKIFGIDNRKVYVEQDLGDGVSLFRVDQGDERQLTEFTNQAGGRFDVIIDDAGHHMQPQQTAFRILFPHVVPGGLYVIEDLQTCYDSQFGGGYCKDSTTAEMLKRMLDDILSGKLEGGVSSIHFYSKIAFIFKTNDINSTVENQIDQ